MLLEGNQTFVQEFVALLERLVEDRPKSEKLDDYQKLKSLKAKSYGPASRFRLERMAFGWSIDLAVDFYDFNDFEVLRHIRRELLGEVPSWHKYALQDDFVEMLRGEFAAMYYLICEVWAGLLVYMNELEELEQVWPEYSDLNSQLHTYVGDRLQPTTLYELVAIHIGRLVLNFPMTNADEFDMSWGRQTAPIMMYSGCNAENMLVKKQVFIDQIAHLFRQMSGDEILFVDISFLAGGQGFFYNLR